MIIIIQGALPDVDPEAENILRSIKSRAMYGEVKQRVDSVKQQNGGKVSSQASSADNGQQQDKGAVQLYQPPDLMAGAAKLGGGGPGANQQLSIISGGASAGSQSSTQVAIRKAASMPKPSWHAPWKLYRVISGQSLL